MRISEYRSYARMHEEFERINSEKDSEPNRRALERLGKTAWWPTYQAVAIGRKHELDAMT